MDDDEWKRWLEHARGFADKVGFEFTGSLSESITLLFEEKQRLRGELQVSQKKYDDVLVEFQHIQSLNDDLKIENDQLHGDVVGLSKNRDFLEDEVASLGVEIEKARETIEELRSDCSFLAEQLAELG